MHETMASTDQYESEERQMSEAGDPSMAPSLADSAQVTSTILGSKEGWRPSTFFLHNQTEPKIERKGKEGRREYS
jgi:hypothetical protein